jgi:hypothetical protein
MKKCDHIKQMKTLISNNIKWLSPDYVNYASFKQWSAKLIMSGPRLEDLNKFDNKNIVWSRYDHSIKDTN